MSGKGYIPISGQKPIARAASLTQKGPRQAATAFNKVLFVVDTLDLGGTETQMMQMARQLKTRGHSVTVACLHPRGMLEHDLINAGIPVAEFPKLGALLSLSGVYQMLRLSWFIRRNKFDVVHAHDLWANLMAVPAARMARTPMILSSQRDLGHLFWYTPFRCRVIAAIHGLSTRVLANSSAVKKMLVERFRVNAERVHVLRNSVDLERFSTAEADRQRIFPGMDASTRLVAVVANMHSPVKGHHDLIEAARIICSEIPQVKFILVGDGDERSKIEEHAVQAGVRERFILLGRRKDVPDILACCELFILPSRAEGFPNVVLEAMAAGLPVVATRVGGTPEIIEDGVSGLLVPPEASQSLAAAVLRVMKDPLVAADLGRAAEQRVKAHFSFDRLLAETEQLYGVRTSSKVQNPVSTDLIKESL